MGFLKVFTTSTILLTISQAASFSTLHDICDTTKTQKCPNISKEVTLLQKFINIDSKNKIAVTGKWNSQTKEAIVSFQKEHGLPATGYVGQITKNQLNSELAKKLALLKSKKQAVKLAKKSEKTPKVAIKNIKTKATNKSAKIEKVTSKKVVAKVLKKSAIKKIALQTTKVKKVVKQPTAKKIALAKKTTPKVKVNLKKLNSYEAFRKAVNLRKSFAVYKDSKLLSKAKRARTVLKVDVSEQRVKLLVNGKVALSAPCTTGAKRKFEPNTRTYRDKHTPYGTFKIMEKIATKRSTIFVDIYRHGKRIYHGDRRKYKGSFRGVKVVGAPLYNWMRLTSGGIGLHASSHVKRYPGSNGCIRLPKNVSNMLFSKLRRGSIVKVVN